MISSLGGVIILQVCQCFTANCNLVLLKKHQFVSKLRVSHKDLATDTLFIYIYHVRFWCYWYDDTVAVIFRILTFLPLLVSGVALSHTVMNSLYEYMTVLLHVLKVLVLSYYMIVRNEHQPGNWSTELKPLIHSAFIKALGFIGLTV